MEAILERFPLKTSYLNVCAYDGLQIQLTYGKLVLQTGVFEKKKRFSKPFLFLILMCPNRKLYWRSRKSFAVTAPSKPRGSDLRLMSQKARTIFLFTQCNQPVN